MVKCYIMPYEKTWANKHKVDPMTDEDAKPCRFRKEGVCTVDPNELEFQFNWSGGIWCETRAQDILEEIRSSKNMKEPSL